MTRQSSAHGDNLGRASPSAQLAALGAELEERTGTVSIGEVVDRLGKTGIGMTLLILSLPALIPIPGPIGLVFGSTVAVVGLQLCFGARRLMIPKFVRVRQLPIKAVRIVVAKAVPMLMFAERYMSPRRLLPLTGTLGQMALGIPLSLMGLAIVLPVPLGNIPPVASLIVLSLGLTMRDGVAVLVGLILAIAALGWFALLFFLGAETLDWLRSLAGVG